MIANYKKKPTNRISYSLVFQIFLYSCCFGIVFLVLKISVRNKNFVKFDKINDGKHLDYSRQHISNARLSMHKKK